MSSLRKFKRKSTAHERKEIKRKEKKKLAIATSEANIIKLGGRILKRVKDARVGIQLMCFINIMHYEFGVDVAKLRKLPEWIDDLQWYLRFSYNAKGQIVKIPSFKLLDTCMQIRREKRYTPIVRVAKDKTDEITVDILKTLIQLEMQLLWIVVTKIEGFGKIKLAKLQERLHDMEQHITYDEQVALRKKLWEELYFSFDECTEDDFTTWTWDNQVA